MRLHRKTKDPRSQWFGTCRSDESTERIVEQRHKTGEVKPEAGSTLHVAGWCLSIPFC